MLDRLLARLPFTFLALAFVCGYSAMEQHRRAGGFDGKAIAFVLAAVLAVLAAGYGLSRRHQRILRHDELQESDRGVR